MAQYNSYVQIPHSSYNEWRTATLGNGYNVDYWYNGGWGNQCWDYCAELWYQYELRLITKPSGNGGAADCWLVSKDANSKPPFIAVYGKENIRRGDVIITDRNNGRGTGHICFADEDYRGTDRLNTLGQVPSLHGQNGVVSVDEISISLFLGIFRNTMWTSQPEPPVPPVPPYNPEEGNTDWKRDRFPWAIALQHWDY